jgi:biotin operon repressor
MVLVALERRIGILKALADSSRLAVVNALLERPHCAEDLATRLHRSPSTITFHLKKLEEAGLIKKSRNQYYGIFELRADLLEVSLKDFVTHPASEDSPEQKRLRKSQEKVLQTFVKNGKLVQLPKQWKKQRIILDELASRLEPSREYLEKELNLELQAFYPDYCTLRRLLIEEGYMTRDAGRYRLNEGQVNDMATRAEIKRNFKEAPKEAGIFQIKNSVTGRVYLGSSLNLHGPLNKHRFTLKYGSHDVPALQKDYNELGANAFRFEILECVKPSDEPDFRVEDELTKLEQVWIEKLTPFGPNGYNPSQRIRE